MKVEYESMNQEERAHSLGNAESPIIKVLFSIRNQVKECRNNANALLNQFGRIDTILQRDKEPSEDLKKEQDFSELTLHQKLNYLDQETAQLDKQLVDLNEKFQMFL
jgi:hypothetical protein